MLEKTLESPLDCKEIQPVHPKGYKSWVFIGRTDVEAETPILWPSDVKSWLIWTDPAWCWERLKARGEGDNRGWDGWMASPTQWIWVWAYSGRWWWTGKPGMPKSMGLLIVGHDWASELNWTTYLSLEYMCIFRPFLKLSFQASSSSYSFSHLSIRNYIWLFRKNPLS